MKGWFKFGSILREDAGVRRHYICAGACDTANWHAWTTGGGCGRLSPCFFFLVIFVVLSSVVCELYKVMQTRRLADSLCKKDGDVRRDFEYPAVSFCACPPSWVGAYYKVDRSLSKRNLPRNSSMSVLFFIQRDVFFIDWESNP